MERTWWYKQSNPTTIWVGASLSQSGFANSIRIWSMMQTARRQGEPPSNTRTAGVALFCFGDDPCGSDHSSEGIRRHRSRSVKCGSRGPTVADRTRDQWWPEAMWLCELVTRRHSAAQMRLTRRTLARGRETDLPTLRGGWNNVCSWPSTQHHLTCTTGTSASQHAHTIHMPLSQKM